MTASLHVGSAIATFPIPTGTPLAGYMARTEPSSGTLDDLEIGVVALSVTPGQLVVVSVDVVGVDAALRDDLADATGIPADTLLLAATHTHSGPSGLIPRLHPAEGDTLNAELRARFLTVAAATIRSALDALRPATLSHETMRASGSWSNRNNPDGPVDDRIRLLIARDGAERVATILALHPCHPTILGAESTVVSADLVGGLRQALRAQFGTDQVVVLTGAAGDISTRFTRHASTPAEITRLAMRATSERGGEHAIAATTITHVTQTTRLPSALAMSDVEPETELAAARSAWEHATREALPPADIRRALTRYQGAQIRMRLRDIPQTRFDVTLGAWTLGPELAIVTIPGELFTSLGQRIEAASPFAQTWVVGYTNSYVGYLVDAEAELARTYEAMASPFGTGAGERIVDVATSLLGERANQ